MNSGRRREVLIGEVQRVKVEDVGCELEQNSMEVVTVSSQNSSESSASPIQRTNQLLGSDTEAKASFGAPLSPA